MREILFRGKPLGKIDEDFVYGSLGVISTDLVAIYQCEEYYEDIITLVDIGTVGQYTGLNDKNETKIFEGDIVMFGFSPCVVKYDLTNSRYMFYDRGIYLKNGFNVDTMKTKEVVGNITDNPELLGGD